jgi:hypothetical protein
MAQVKSKIIKCAFCGDPLNGQRSLRMAHYEPELGWIEDLVHYDECFDACLDDGWRSVKDYDNKGGE